MPDSGSTTVTCTTETSVPTDMTVTSDGDSELQKKTTNNKFMKELAQQKNLEGNLLNIAEKLRMEIEAKKAELLALNAMFESAQMQHAIDKETIKNEHVIITTRLQVELKNVKENLLLIKEKAAREITNLANKCMQFKDTQDKLLVKDEDIRSSILNLPLDEVHFNALNNRPQHELNLKEYFSLQMLKKVLPYIHNNKSLEEQNADLKDKLKLLQLSNDHLSEEKHLLNEQLQRLQSSNVRLEKDSRSEDFKVRNFDRVKNERDLHELEKDELKKRHNDFILRETSVQNERDILTKKLNHLNLAHKELTVKLDYYEREVISTKNSNDSLKDQVETLNRKLNVKLERSCNLNAKCSEAQKAVATLEEQLKDSELKCEMLQNKVIHLTASEMAMIEKHEIVSRKYNLLLAEVERSGIEVTKETEDLTVEVNSLRNKYDSLFKAHKNLIENHSSLMEEIHNIKSEKLKEKLGKDQQMQELQSKLHSLENSLSKYESMDEYRKVITRVAALGYSSYDTKNNMLPAYDKDELLCLTRRVLQIEAENEEACSTIHKLTNVLGQMRRSASSIRLALQLADKPVKEALKVVSEKEYQVLELEATLKEVMKSDEITELQLVQCRQQLREAQLKLKEQNIVIQQFNQLQRQLNELNAQINLDT